MAPLGNDPNERYSVPPTEYNDNRQKHKVTKDGNPSYKLFPAVRPDSPAITNTMQERRVSHRPEWGSGQLSATDSTTKSISVRARDVLTSSFANASVDVNVGERERDEGASEQDKSAQLETSIGTLTDDCKSRSSMARGDDVRHERLRNSHDAHHGITALPALHRQPAISVPRTSRKTQAAHQPDHSEHDLDTKLFSSTASNEHLQGAQGRPRLTLDLTKNDPGHVKRDTPPAESQQCSSGLVSHSRKRLVIENSSTSSITSESTGILEGPSVERPVMSIVESDSSPIEHAKTPGKNPETHEPRPLKRITSRLFSRSRRKFETAKSGKASVKTPSSSRHPHRRSPQVLQKEEAKASSIRNTRADSPSVNLHEFTQSSHNAECNSISANQQQLDGPTSDPIETLKGLGMQTDAIYARLSSLRSERAQLTSTISPSLREITPGSDYAEFLLDRLNFLNAIISSMEVCFSRLQSLDRKREEATANLLALIPSRDTNVEDKQDTFDSV